MTDGAKLKPGGTTLKGIAFDGGKGIKEVAVSIDGGKSWTPAKLGKDLGKYSFREWKLPVKLAAGSHELKVRATNNAGDTQPMEPFWNPAGYLAQRRRNRSRHRGVRRIMMPRSLLLALATVAGLGLPQLRPRSTTSFRRKPRHSSRDRISRW